MVDADATVVAVISAREACCSSIALALVWVVAVLHLVVASAQHVSVSVLLQRCFSQSMLLHRWLIDLFLQLCVLEPSLEPAMALPSATSCLWQLLVCLRVFDTQVILACTLPAFVRRSAARAALLLHRVALLCADRADQLMRRAARVALLLARELLRSRAPLRRELLRFFVCRAELFRELLRPARYLVTADRAMKRLLRLLDAVREG